MKKRKGSLNGFSFFFVPVTKPLDKSNEKVVLNMAKQIGMYGNKVFGETVSDYGLENGYLDYYTLAKIVGNRVLNNDIYLYAGCENWELACGCEEDEDGYLDIYQYYIVTDYGYTFLSEYTDEIVYYHQELDMYLWGITHFGTSWDYVLTDIELVNMDI